MLLLLLVVSVCTRLCVAAGLRVLEPLHCTPQSLGCRGEKTNCLDEGWLRPRNFTPTGPSNLDLNLINVVDEQGRVVPVLSVTWNWTIDGSVKFMDGTEVHLLKMSDNQNICVRYIFSQRIQDSHLKDFQSNTWPFVLNNVVVDPGEMYLVSVSNLPKPNIHHDSYSVTKTITIPGCDSPEMKMITICLERGSRWEPNIVVERTLGAAGKENISVSFNRGEFSSFYKVSVHCSFHKSWKNISQAQVSPINVMFDLNSWPSTCCSFVAEVRPFFKGCQNRCARFLKTFNICPEKHLQFPVWLIAVITGVFACALACFTYFMCRKSRTDKIDRKAEDTLDAEKLKKPIQPLKKVLIIYSLDHPLYKDIVLKLSAFLIAECGTEVVLDLLDSTSLGTMGRMQWLERQKQMCDKILILCSQGVQAKWKAMCGGGRVTLREDVCSPTGDMLTPALTLIIPDLLQPLAFGKYMVAYFDEVFAKEDVPPPFNITLKYKLMKHFEELFFRILDQEKHEPGKVKRIEGIAEDEYINSASGRSLRDAIEAFQAHQLEHPEWFEKECVDDEEVWDSAQQCPLLADSGESSILYFVPEYKEGHPTLVNEVQVLEDTNGITSQSLLVNDGEGVFSQEVYPDIHLNHSSVQSLHPIEEHAYGMRLVGVKPSASQEFYPFICRLSGPEERDFLQQQSEGERGLQGEQHEGMEHSSHLDPDVLQSLLALQQSLVSNEKEAEAVHAVKRPSSKMDEGYVSLTLPQHDSSEEWNSLSALCRLQEACLLNSTLSPHN